MLRNGTVDFIGVFADNSSIHGPDFDITFPISFVSSFDQFKFLFWIYIFRVTQDTR